MGRRLERRTAVGLQRGVAHLARAAGARFPGQRGASGGDLRRPAWARGDYVVTLDADLQDPPEVIARMFAIAIAEGSMSSMASAPTARPTRRSRA